MAELQFLEEFATFRRSKDKVDSGKTSEKIFEKYCDWCRSNGLSVPSRDKIDWFQARLQIDKAFGLSLNTESLGAPNADEMKVPKRGSMRRN